ncbi:hypothetical protein EBS_0345 [endosymbiont of unidentified scaly snail isolate Monju]|nr:hypothetical protein EBS_0345 [endosymbiont of unidentified scaly snail isolate Monju]
MSAQNDSGFLRMFLFVLGALVAFTILIMFAAGSVSETLEEKHGSDSRKQAAIAERIKPVGEVAVAKAGAAPAAPRSGKDVVGAVCGACHATGALNAPKIGSADQWQPRFDANGGLDGLVKSAIAGKGAMPPRGGGNVSDEELRNAITYMLKQAGIDAGAGDGKAAAAAPVSPAQAAADMVGSAVEAATQAAGPAMNAVTEAVAPGASQPAAAPAVEDASALAQAKGCLGCHQVAAKVLGPAYKDVAAKYRGDAGALDRLVAKVKSGGAGVWGQIPMPPNNVSDEEATRLVKWILSLQ